MKGKFFCLFLAMSLVLSVSVVKAQADWSWSEYSTPNYVTSFAITSDEVILFGQAEGYRATLPLPNPPATVNWTSFAIPGACNRGVKNAAVVNGDIFILREDGNVFKHSNNEWTEVLTGICNIAYSPNRLLAWSGNEVRELLPNGAWDLALMPAPIWTITFHNASLFVFCDNRTTYHGTSINDVEYYSVIEDMYYFEAAMNNTNYVVVGNVIGDLAAWYTSPQNQVFKYTHVMTHGEMVSSNSYHDTLYVAGRLSNHGVIFPTDDVGEIKFFEEPISQIRSNESALAALSYAKLYMHGGTVIAGVSKHQLKEKAELLISPNPINNGELRLKSTVVCEKTLLSVDGKEITKFNIAVGDNSFLLPNLKPGVYLLAPGNYKIVVYECH